MKAIVAVILFLTSSFAAEEMSTTGLNELKSYQPIHSCYKKFLQTPTSAGQKDGRLVLEVNLDSTGKVLSAQENFKESTIHERSLNSCIVASLKKLLFPEEVNGNPKTISVPLDFPISATK